MKHKKKFKKIFRKFLKKNFRVPSGLFLVDEARDCLDLLVSLKHDVSEEEYAELRNEFLKLKDAYSDYAIAFWTEGDLFTSAKNADHDLTTDEKLDLLKKGIKVLKFAFQVKSICPKDRYARLESFLFNVEKELSLKEIKSR